MAAPRNQLQDALRLYRQGDLPRAQMLLETLDFEQLPADIQLEANYLWGIVLARRGEALEAAQRFQTCVSRDPRFFPALDAWGNVLANIGDARGAIEKYRRALTVAPKHNCAHVLFNYGAVLMRNGNTLRALHKFRESFRIAPTNADSAYMAGLCFLTLGRPRGARKWFRVALKLKPDSARDHSALGNAYSIEGRDQSAFAAFARALEIDESFHDAWYNWAAALAARKDYAGAIRTVKGGLRHHPRSFELLTQQVFCLRQMGAYDAALAAIRRTRTLLAEDRSSDRAAHFEDALTANESGVLRGLGRLRQARVALLDMLRRSPEPCPNVLAELRVIDSRPLAEARRVELMVKVHPAEVMFDADEAGRTRPYQRTYWVVAANAKDARRMIRELEPTEASVRFESGASVIEELKDAVQGILERTPAMPVE